MQVPPIRCNPDAVTRALAVAALAILAASVAGRFAALHVDDALVRHVSDFLYVDNEENLPTGFAVLLLLAAAALLAIVAMLERSSGGRWTWHWAALAAGFAVMTVDEAWSFHEKLIVPGRALLGGGELGIFFYAWVVFALALLALLAPFFFGFLVQLPKDTRFRILVAGTLYVGGALGMELVAGHFNELHALDEDKKGYGPRHFQYSLIATAEEGLEFAGLIVFLRALLLHTAGKFGEVRFRLGAAP
jgi:hypothetical protein